jgi:uncharacterized protein (DUF433 family)
MIRKKSDTAGEVARPGPNGSAEKPSAPTRQAGKIVCTPGVCGGKARIHGTRIPVWGLEHARQNGCSDRQILEMFPGLVRADLAAAWKYVERHKSEIGQQIRANEE